VPFVLARVALGALLTFAPGESPSLRLAAEGLDEVALESGVRVRVGNRIDGWDIEVRATELRGTYQIELREPEHSEPELRVVSLVGETDEDRSRELAATLALIIMEAPDPMHDPQLEADREPVPEPRFVPRAVLSLEGHVGLGPPRHLDMDLGAGLGAGVWLARHHLQPRLRAWWSHSSAEDLRVDGVSVGAGLAGGAPIGRWWIGLLALPTFKWTRGIDRKPAVALSGGGELTAMVQVRRPRWVLGLRSGIETTFRPVLIRGSNDVIRWGPVRWVLVLELGVGLGRVELR
jgi:hypothetical protein